MAAYLMTHSLLYSWLYTMKENPREDTEDEESEKKKPKETPMQEFMLALRREPTPTNKAMQNGIDFENLVTAIIQGNGDKKSSWYDAAEKVSAIVGGGQRQYKAKKVITVDGMNFLLYGLLDVLKAGTIYDIKFSSRYERGKFFNSTQHPAYLELIPEAERFTYVISDGTNVWTETYWREETASIYVYISNFIDWLKSVNLLDVYKKHWVTKS